MSSRYMTIETIVHNRQRDALTYCQYVGKFETNIGVIIQMDKDIMVTFYEQRQYSETQRPS